MKTLLFDVYGGLSAFGGIAEGTLRPVDVKPTRTGMFGLIGNCLGYDRQDIQALDNLSEDLGFAVGTVRSGDNLIDYHTVQTIWPKKDAFFNTRAEGLRVGNIHTSLTFREWRVDTLYVVALWSRNGKVDLEQIKDALLRPARTPFLGRKAAPFGTPMMPRILDVIDPAEALSADKAGERLMEVFHRSSQGHTVPGVVEISCDEDMPGVPSSARRVPRRDTRKPGTPRAFAVRNEVIFPVGRAA